MALKPGKKLALSTQIFIALVAGIDRIFDMGRTVVNITGDASCAIVISQMEHRRIARETKKWISRRFN